MQADTLRKRMLWLFVACLALTAAIAIVVVLSGTWSLFVARVLSSSASISAASICGMSCAAFIERGRQVAWGHAGVLLALATLIVAWAAIWTDSPGDAQIKLTMVMVVWTVAFAHAELLLLPKLAREHAWVQLAAVAAIAALALLLTYIVIDQRTGDAIGRVLATLSIFVALLTLVVPVLWRIGGAARGASAAHEQLVLTKGEDGAWCDRAGNRYSVQPIDESRST